MMFICANPLDVLAGYETDIFLAAQTGDGESQYALALLYEYGGENIERNADNAALWFEKAAQKRIAGACLYLGIKYENGSGVAQNYEKAHCMYLCAAQQDWAMAQFFLASLYDQGKGVVYSPLIALAWFGLARESGYPKAEIEFSRIQRDGGFNDLDALRELQGTLMQKPTTPCN